MSEYDNNNTGALFKNDRKETERHPDYNGSCEVNGVEMWMSAWIKTSKGGKKFMSVTLKDQQPSQAPKPIQAASSGFDSGEDIPF